MAASSTITLTVREGQSDDEKKRV
ncbi:hypothetical protein A2U01_0104849, partial [Trifolium medium]|nr:hypothetical protein [Trifolium medium]